MDSYAEDSHEFEEHALTWEGVMKYAIEDADPCRVCEADYRLLNSVALDRIEIEGGEYQEIIVNF